MNQSVDKPSRFAVPFRLAMFLIIVLPLVIFANLAIWSAFNQPHSAESWTGEIVGYDYSPYRFGQNPNKGSVPTTEQIDEDLKLLSQHAQAIRTYSTIEGLDVIPDIAGKYGLSVALGAWVDQRRERNDEEIKSLIKLAWKKNVVRLIVGNESILRGDLEAADIITYIRQVKQTVWKPVSTAEPWHVWLKHPELVKEVDYIAIHLLPYWEGVDVKRSIPYILDELKQVQDRYPDKPIVITEVGWPSGGKVFPRRLAPGAPQSQWDEESVPSLVNEATFLREFMNEARKLHLTYYVMEAFDQPWKIENEGAAGAFWGVYDASRKPKFPMAGEIIEAPHWRIYASIAVGLAMIPAVLFVLRRHHVKPLGVVTFMILTQIAASAIAWAGLSATGLYFTTTQIVVWSFLFLCQGLLLIVLLAEAIEFVEVIWTREGDRSFKPFAHDIDYSKNKVSIHVPIHNEPPEMVCETLNALARLDYPNFEVLILDNNTRDPAVWEPVRAHCEKLGEKFRFFHLENWPGFKAGALNYGLSQTAEDADIVAVIDSDYQVIPSWLRTMVPYFEKQDVAVVQGPQDYRDGHESMFKNMVYWEYAGFFHIGMVQRNNFNAIIQHGTMTMVRKTALQGADGWAEWCICEDAELGLKLYRQGYDSVYVSDSFGRGLTPDTLAGYIGQRFRWAYGAVQIVKHHWKALLPWNSKGGLTPAQRYYFIAGWLPWFADGLALIFTVTSFFVSVWALIDPKSVSLPVAAFLIPTIGSFAFKFIRSLALYAVRVKGAGFWNSLGAGVAALALTHTVAKAVLQGFITKDKPFFRTPKLEDQPGLSAVFIQVREEAVMLTIIWGLAIAFLMSPSFSDTQSRLWVAVLFVQSIPYAAAVLLSFINVVPSLFRKEPSHDKASAPAQ